MYKICFLLVWKNALRHVPSYSFECKDDGRFMKGLSCLFVCLFFTWHCAWGQPREWGLEIKPKLGFLMAHRGVMGHLPEQHALGGEISLYARTDGRKKYQQRYNYPNIGVTLFGSTVGNMELLGTYWGTYGFIEFPFAKNDKMEFTGKMGTGFAYGTKVFDQELNPKNVAMSTHLNALICLGIQYRYFFGNTHMVAGIDLTHCSNGSTKVPNLGINLPYLSLGVGHTFNKVEKIVTREDFVPAPWKFSLLGILSVKEVFPTGERKYPIYAFSLLGEKIFGPKSGMEASFDVMYKTSINAYKPAIHKSKEGITQMGVYAGYVLPLDKLHFVLGMGMYIRDEYFPDDRFYHRLGMRYYVTDHFMINFTLKTHWAKADYVEYGIGYTL